jgi:hypothetical protein
VNPSLDNLRLLLLISFMLLSSASFGNSIIGQCETKAGQYGNGSGDDVIPSECADLFKQEANQAARVKTSKEEIYGFKNLLVFQSLSPEGKVSFISGKSSHLKEIVALDFDEKSQELVVLEQSGLVLTFSITHRGNISPRRVFRSPLLANADSILIDVKNDKLTVHHKKKKLAILIPRQADERGRPNARKLKISSQVEQVVQVLRDKQGQIHFK